MDWRTLPGFDEKYSRITIKEHKTFGGKTIEVLYGAQDENGNPVGTGLKENWKDYIGAIAEISCMEITENQQGGWGFRHPKLLSIRVDKAPTDCTIEQIK